MQFTWAIRYDTVGLYNNNKKKSHKILALTLNSNPNLTLALDFINLNLKITV